MLSFRSLWSMALLLVFCLAPSIAFSQTIVNGPVTTANKAVWDQSDVATAAAAAALTPRFRIDGLGPFSPTGTTCVPFVPTTANKWTCSVNINAAMVAQLNLTGSHSMVL